MQNNNKHLAAMAAAATVSTMQSIIISTMQSIIISSNKWHLFSVYEDVLKLLKMQKKDSERNLYCAPENYYIQRGWKFVYFSTLKFSFLAF